MLLGLRMLSSTDIQMRLRGRTAVAVLVRIVASCRPCTRTKIMSEADETVLMLLHAQVMLHVQRIVHNGTWTTSTGCRMLLYAGSCSEKEIARKPSRLPRSQLSAWSRRRIVACVMRCENSTAQDVLHHATAAGKPLSDPWQCCIAGAASGGAAPSTPHCTPVRVRCNNEAWPERESKQEIQKRARLHGAEVAVHHISGSDTERQGLA